MKFSVRFSSLILALALVAAACSSDDTTDTTAGQSADTTVASADTTVASADTTVASADTTAPSSSVDRTLRVGVSALPITLDPEFAPGQESVEIITNVLESLYWYEAEAGPDGVMSATELAKGDGGMIPALVESTDISDDNLTYTLHLRQGVMSSAGNEFTSEDVRWMLERNFGVAVVGAFVVGIAKIPSMDNVTVIDDYTVEITITAENPIFFRSLQLQTISPVDSTVAKEHATADDPWATEWMRLDNVGFGPYSVKEFTPGTQLVLESNKNYWRGEPFFEEIIYREIPDSSQRLTLLKQGQIDVAENLNSLQLDSLSAEEGKVRSVVRNQVVFAAMNTLGGPTADPKVRQALQYALDSDQIVSNVYAGDAKSLALVAPEEYPGYNAALWPYPSGGDIEQAKALLAEAGFAEGFQISLLVNADVSDHSDVAVLIRDSLAEIGVDVVIDTKPAAAYLDQASSGDIGMVLHQGYAIVSEISYHYQLYVSGPTGFLSFGGYNNPRFDAAIAESLSVLPGSERTALVEEIQQIVADDVPHLSVVGAPTKYGFGPDIEGYTWYPNNQIWFYDLSRN